MGMVLYVLATAVAVAGYCLLVFAYIPLLAGFLIGSGVALGFWAGIFMERGSR